ncbi:pas pac sensor hybrid histidine kinase : Multi-sensor hybrid histidine kinase OS=Chthoniobacter flavus Ellin428 GN=CfE428DRAFT_1844 PE=4 SV=1: PAS: PAS_3: HisKA: HATPase_c: Response_reg [Gemmata massiliana]|uniref:histidine kinase n=1 Tax=Gemmata massiliana TaxID=1210884 RepID=A0A6P2CS73_9BACT|nr:PAS domain-containing sensor histidine kinase [Gemmata massiliana]VTR91948.1 pas pac sensor hybrid histidine kinase : Multi-sensor hybrid histidine kinase OS=Chthoniobacter flavus Ellin428 GN=CfE428DRAFT_1844 PE=4 SV=1: PAS: PAS_3: HisKA: HATPase_c: Response_reg [Gemmata massiliana]
MSDSPAPPVPPDDAGAEAARQLRFAHQKLAAHAENTPLIVIEWDRETRVSRWNAQAERVFGWTAAEVLGKGLLEWKFVHEDNRELAHQIASDRQAGSAARRVVVTPNYTKGGGLVWCEWYTSVLFDDAGNLISTLSLALDVTPYRATAEELEHSRARLRAALDGAKMLAWDMDLTTNTWETTIDISDFYGVPHGPDYSNPELALNAVHPDDLALVTAGRQRAIETGEPMQYEFRGRAPAADGFPRWFSTRGQVLRDTTGKAVRIIAVTSDITEHKRAEEQREALNRQLRDAAKWESLGVLAGGVAHDFNNILTVVLGSANLARRGLPANSSAAAYLDQIEQSCRRAAEVCRQMLSYAGRNLGGAARIDLTPLVRESAPLLAGPAAPHNVRYELAHDLPLTHADSAQVRQVLVNLVTNSAEALAGASGEIVVRTYPAEIPTGMPDGTFHLAPAPGRYACLAVSDTGPGVSAEVRGRMFDPFYSTKFTGRGLGLAAVLGIVRAHKGGIRVESAPGVGTTVTVYWPGPVEQVASVPAANPSSSRATNAALVIDDEMFVREVTASTLEELGFTAILAADGASGIEQFHRNRDAIKVAVIDVMMPGVTGDQVLKTLRLFAPQLPAILVSGFTDKRIVTAEFGAHTEFLQKPFHPEDLMNIVRRLTEEKG